MKILTKAKFPGYINACKKETNQNNNLKGSFNNL